MFNLLTESQTVTMFIPLIVAVMVPIFMAVVTWHKKVVEKQNKEIKGTTFKVRYSKLVIGSLIVLIAVLIVATALFPILYACDIPDGPPLEVVAGTTCGFGISSIPCVILLFVFQRWQIAVSDEKIEVVPMFGKRREYAWEDIEKVNAYGRVYGNMIIFKAYKIGSTKKAFSFNSYMPGAEKFAKMLESRGLLIYLS